MKKFISNILIKKFKKHYKGTTAPSNENKLHYLFLRWLAECFKSKETTNVYSAISSYIFLNYKNLTKFFSDVFVLNDTVFIVTRFPGCIIGKGGETINGIAEYLNKNIDNGNHNYKIELIEDTNSSMRSILDNIKFLSYWNEE